MNEYDSPDVRPLVDAIVNIGGNDQIKRMLMSQLQILTQPGFQFTDADGKIFTRITTGWNIA